MRPRLRRARSARSGDAACHITEECERLFCETLKTVFLVEKNTALETSLVMDMQSNDFPGTATSRPQPVQSPLLIQQQQHEARPTIMRHGQPTPSTSPGGRDFLPVTGLLRDYVEMWDYKAEQRFRGFVAEKDDGARAMLAFFDREVVGKDLKPGLMSLLELASSEHFDCAQLIACVDRTAEPDEVAELHRSLNWVGFDLMMLDEWAGEKACLSDRWTFLGLDL